MNNMCHSCLKRKAKETLKHNGRALRVCGPCGRSIKERRARAKETT